MRVRGREFELLLEDVSKALANVAERTRWESVGDVARHLF